MKRFSIFSVLCTLTFAILMFGGCAKRSKSPEDMSLDELKGQIVALMEDKQNPDAIVYLEKIE